MQTISDYLTRTNRAARRRAFIGKAAACAALLAVEYWLLYRCLVALSGG